MRLLEAARCAIQSHPGGAIWCLKGTSVFQLKMEMSFFKTRMIFVLLCFVFAVSSICFCYITGVEV